MSSFNDSSSEDGRLGAVASDVLATELVRTGLFTVVERQRLEEVLAEQDLGRSGLVSSETATRIGGLLGVQAVAVGSITVSGGASSETVAPGTSVRTDAQAVGVDLRLVSTDTGEVLYADSRLARLATRDVHVLGSGASRSDETTGARALRVAIAELVTAMCRAIDGWQPRPLKVKVVKAQEDKVWLNAGRGLLSVGDEWEVMSPGEDVVDPDTGVVLFTETEFRAVIRITQAELRYSVAEMVRGDLPTLGDTVVVAFDKVHVLPGAGTVLRQKSGEHIELVTVRNQGVVARMLTKLSTQRAFTLSYTFVHPNSASEHWLRWEGAGYMVTAKGTFRPRPGPRSQETLLGGRDLSAPTDITIKFDGKRARVKVGNDEYGPFEMYDGYVRTPGPLGKWTVLMDNESEIHDLYFVVGDP